MSENPLLSEWTTPFGIPPFDRIRPEHYPAAFARGMAEHAAELDKLAAESAEPSFANTVEALERSGRLLDRARLTFFNLAASQASEAMQAVEREWAPRLAAHGMTCALHPGVFRRVEALHRRRSLLALAPDQDRLLVRLYGTLKRNGAALPSPARARLTEISSQLAALQTTFGQNVLGDEDGWVMELTEADLDGIPTFLREAAQEAARERGAAEGFAFTLARSSAESFLTFSARRDLRQRVHAAWVSRGANPGTRDNRPLIREILTLRQERAALLGHHTFADMRLEDTMAGSPKAAEALLTRVWAPARLKAAEERAGLEALARADGQTGPFEAWDWRYYAEQARRLHHDIDQGALKAYFSLENIIGAAFDVTQRLFGTALKEVTGLPLYHPDVRAFEATDAAGRHLGLLLLDNFARSGKRSGAWMSSYRIGHTFDGKVAPIVVINNNVAKSAPALLSFDEAETFFHELGHGLHGLLSRARYPAQSGTAVLKDFVEFPSQILEHWLSVPAVLQAHARHHETGMPIPEMMVQRLLAARSFGQGFETTEFVAAALIDLAFHTIENPSRIDVPAFEADFLQRIGMPSAIGLRHRPAHFTHLFSGGYAAGYYSYLWSEVLDADGFDAFKEAGDFFDPNLAARLRVIYEAGDTRDPMDLYVAFRGREPNPDALLRNRGLI